MCRGGRGCPTQRFLSSGLSAPYLACRHRRHRSKTCASPLRSIRNASLAAVRFATSSSALRSSACANILLREISLVGWPMGHRTRQNASRYVWPSYAQPSLQYRQCPAQQRWPRCAPRINRPWWPRRRIERPRGRVAGGRGRQARDQGRNPSSAPRWSADYELIGSCRRREPPRVLVVCAFFYACTPRTEQVC